MELKLGAAIKKLRTEKGLTQEELAQKIGVSFQAVSKWETNTTTPDIALLPALALFFGVSIDELFSVNSDDYMERISNMLRDEHTLSTENFTWVERYLKGFLSENPMNNDARTLLVELYEHRMNRDSLAQGRYAEEGILVDPADVALNGKLSHIREQRNEFDRLIAFYEPLASKYPKNNVIIGNLVGAYIKQRYFEKARELIEVSEPRPIHELYLGDIELELGSIDKAKAIWEGTVKKYPSDWETLLDAAERFNKACDYSTAIALYEKSYEVSPYPKPMDTLYARAFLFDKLGRTAEAIEMWEKIIMSFDIDYHITKGEAVDWPKRELQKLKAKL